MGNILEYVQWCGDLSFDENLINELDILVLTMISYIDLKINTTIGCCALYHF